LSSSEIEIRTGLPSAEVTLLDHTGAVVANSSGGALHQDGLEAGLYRVQVETGATLTEELVPVHEGASVTHAVHLLLPTVTPVKGAAINNELHSGPAQQLSIAPTRVLGAGGRLVLFVRVTERCDELPPVSTGGLSLLDEHEASLLPAPLPVLLGPGYAGLSVDLTPGTYLLRAPVEDGRTADQAVSVLEGWTTYLFLPAAPDPGRERAPWVPSPTAIVAHMKELGQAFEPYDYGSDAFFAAEMALDGLRAGQLVLPWGGWDFVLQNAELNPMLGIYLGHAALAHSAPPLDELSALVQRLRHVVPGHSDAEALRCALLDRAGDQSASGTPPLSAPPMLRSSYQALIARDAVEPLLLVDGSLAEHAATRQRADGVWLRWDTPTGEEVVEVDAATMARAASALGDVVDLSDIVPEREAPSEPDLESKPERVSFGSDDWFGRFRNHFERNLGIARGPRGPSASQVQGRIRGESEEVGLGPPQYREDFDAAPVLEPSPTPAPAPETTPGPTSQPAPGATSGVVSRGVADLATMISRMAEHVTDCGPVSVGDLSRQLGLPVSTVRAGLAEIAGSSASDG
jgi:hypothetical protein